jgi:glycosyltransferase involved in cell wall biosynthesis
MSLQNNLTSLARPVRVVYVSSYIPRKCGIATFTKDLTTAINLLNPLALAEIAAMDNTLTKDVIVYPHEVRFRIFDQKKADYIRVATAINKDPTIDVVCLQHEFGIYGGHEGRLVLEFLKKLRKPVVVTLHSVVENPSPRSRAVLASVCRKASAVVVMLASSREALVAHYGVSQEKIVVIHHGVPDFPRLDISAWKKRLSLDDRVVATSINLLSEHKGIEHVVGAIGDIIRKVPNFLYLIIGETHPMVLAYEGGKDVYREKLYQLVGDLGIGKHVRFIQRYIPIEELVAYIGASDFYITPYQDPNQAASGGLAYAIGAGKLCMSTPYLYAKEMLNSTRGILVPFKDSKAIAEAVIRMVVHPKKKAYFEKNAYEIGRTMTWINIGHQYYHLFHNVLGLH